MELDEAKRRTKEFYELRRKIRAALLLAVRCHCVMHSSLFTDEEKRKLANYPSDFREDKLLLMLGRK